MLHLALDRILSTGTPRRVYVLKDPEIAVIQKKSEQEKLVTLLCLLPSPSQKHVHIKGQWRLKNERLSAHRQDYFKIPDFELDILPPHNSTRISFSRIPLALAL